MKLNLIALTGPESERKIHLVFGLSRERMLEINHEVSGIIRTLSSEEVISNTGLLYDVLSQLEGNTPEELAFMAYMIGGFCATASDLSHDILSHSIANTFR